MNRGQKPFQSDLRACEAASLGLELLNGCSPPGHAGLQTPAVEARDERKLCICQCMASFQGLDPSEEGRPHEEKVCSCLHGGANLSQRSSRFRLTQPRTEQEPSFLLIHLRHTRRYCERAATVHYPPPPPPPPRSWTLSSAAR